MDSEAPAEFTASDVPLKLCLHCQQPVTPPKRKHLVKDFCSDRHRAAYREDQMAAAQARAVAEMDALRVFAADVIGQLEQKVALIAGIIQQLDKFRRKKRRKPTDAALVLTHSSEPPSAALLPPPEDSVQDHAGGLLTDN